MKKIFMKNIVVLAFFTMLLLSACGSQGSDESHYVEIEGVTRRIMPQGSLTVEHFLEDLDYMIYVLENNFPLLDVAYWAHGVDYNALAARARESVLAMEEPCEDTFHGIIHYHFIPLFNIGHFAIVHQFFWGSLARNEYYVAAYGGVQWNMNLALIRSQLPSRFYDPDNQERRDIFNATWTHLEETYGLHTDRLRDDAIEPQPVTTRSIEENRIAYISTGPSMWDLRQGRNTIQHFFGQITDYEHLIIDLRGNWGGNINPFLDIILTPNLREPMDNPNAFIFFLDGPYVRRFGDFLFNPSVYNGFLTITEPYRPASEILADFQLPEIRHSDIERLHYGAPAGHHRPLEPTPDDRRPDGVPAFGGKMWLLTDHTLGSSGQLAAWYAMETGHITLVGDRTGGNVGGQRTVAFMPNTGIMFYFDIFYITDSQGRPLEAGTIPHHFNRPGMDALETVLALIMEGEY